MSQWSVANGPPSSIEAPPGATKVIFLSWQVTENSDPFIERRLTDPWQISLAYPMIWPISVTSTFSGGVAFFRSQVSLHVGHSPLLSNGTLQFGQLVSMVGIVTVQVHNKWLQRGKWIFTVWLWTLTVTVAWRRSSRFSSWNPKFAVCTCCVATPLGAACYKIWDLLVIQTALGELGFAPGCPPSLVSRSKTVYVVYRGKRKPAKVRFGVLVRQISLKEWIHVKRLTKSVIRREISHWL